MSNYWQRLKAETKLAKSNANTLYGSVVCFSSLNMIDCVPPSALQRVLCLTPDREWSSHRLISKVNVTSFVQFVLKIRTELRKRYTDHNKGKHDGVNRCQDLGWGQNRPSSHFPSFSLPISLDLWGQNTRIVKAKRPKEKASRKNRVFEQHTPTKAVSLGRVKLAK